MVSIKDVEDYQSVLAIAEHKKQSISRVIADLIHEALEMEREDMYWSKIAMEAEKRDEGKPAIPAEEVWKKMNLD